jgi:hypothetical protein
MRLADIPKVRTPVRATVIQMKSLQPGQPLPPVSTEASIMPM